MLVMYVVASVAAVPRDQRDRVHGIICAQAMRRLLRKIEEFSACSLAKLMSVEHRLQTEPREAMDC